jgi:hypothetical protein
MSAEMSVRYRQFDATVRAEYERALDLAKRQARTPLSGSTSLPLRDIIGGKGAEETPMPAWVELLSTSVRRREGQLWKLTAQEG